jgi:membrane protein
MKKNKGLHKKRGIINTLYRKYIIIPLKILKIAIHDMVHQDGIEHAGYLAFLNIFSLFPFLIFLILIVGAIGASDLGQAAIYSTLTHLPDEITRSILPRIEEIVSGPKHAFLTIAIIGVIWTASSTVEGLRTILNRAYRVHYPPPYLLRRLVSFIEFFVISFSIIAVMLLFVVVPKAVHFIGLDSFSIFNQIITVLQINKFVIFIFLCCAVSLIYYFIPNIKQEITRTFPGAILTVVGWYLTQKLFIFYIQEFHQFNLIYGSLAGIMGCLLFFYLINIIFIVGAQFNYHLHRTYKIFLR